MPRGRPRKRAVETTAAAPLASRPKRVKRGGRAPVRVQRDGVDVDADVDVRSGVQRDGDDDGDDVVDGFESRSQSQSQSSTASPLRKTKDARDTIKALQDFVESTEKEEELAVAYEKMVKDEERRLLRIVEDFDREVKAEEKEFETQFAELLEATLAPTGTLETVPRANAITERTEPLRLNISADEHPLYIASQALLEKTQAMLKDCKKYQKKVGKLEFPEPPGGAWKQDEMEARRIISAAKKVTAAEVDELLAGEKHEGEKNKKRGKKTKNNNNDMGNHDVVGGGKGCDEGENSFEDDVRLQQTLRIGRQAVEKEYGRKKVHGWGNMASRAEKAMKGLVKALPDEEH